MAEVNLTQARKDWILKMDSRKIRILGIVLLVIVSMISMKNLNRSLGSRQRQNFVTADRDGNLAASFRWNPVLFKMLSFGHVPAAVDWLLIRFLTDSNSQKMKDDQSTEAFRILDLATEIDPAFYSLYTAGAGFLSVVRDDRVGALKLIEKGHRYLETVYPTLPEPFKERHWLNAWRIGFIRGYIYMFDFQDMGKAASAYSEMAQYPDVPEAVKLLANSVKVPSRQFVLGLNSLRVFRSWSKDDPVALAELDRKEQMLRLSQEIYLLNQEFSAFRPGMGNLNSRWEAFRSIKGLSKTDSFGGQFYLNRGGQITSTTPRVPVLGVAVD